MPSGIGMEPLMRIELTTSSLPRKCSTPELQRRVNVSLLAWMERIPREAWIRTEHPWARNPWIPDSGAGDEVRTRDLQLGRLSLYQLSYSRMVKHDVACTGGERRIRTSEGFPTELQSVPFGHSGISPNPSLLPDSNQRPTDYKSVALPAELRRRSKL